MLAETQRGGASESRTGLLGREILDPIQGGHATPPEVAVEGNPGAVPEVVAEVSFERTDGLLRLWLGNRNRIRCLVGGVEPRARISVEQPVPPSLRISELRLESPAIDAPIDQLRAVVLTRRHDDLETHPEKSLLLPSYELVGFHCRTTFYVDREAKRRIEQSRAID